MYPWGWGYYENTKEIIFWYTNLISHFLLYLQNYKEFEAEILDLQLEKYGLSFDMKKYITSGWALGGENVIGIRSFKTDPKSCTYFVYISITTVIFINTRWQVMSYWFCSSVL